MSAICSKAFTCLASLIMMPFTGLPERPLPGVQISMPALALSCSRIHESVMIME